VCFYCCCTESSVAHYPNTNSSMTLHLTIGNLNLHPWCGQGRPKVMQSILGPINSGTSTSLRNLILSSSLLLIHSHAAKQAEATGFCMSIALRAHAAVHFSCVCFVAMTTDGCECLGFYGSLYVTMRHVWIENSSWVFKNQFYVGWLYCIN